MKGKNARGRRVTEKDIEVVGTESSPCYGDDPCCGCRDFVHIRKEDRELILALVNAAPALVARSQRLEEVEQAAKNLVAALDACKSVIDGAFLLAHVHGARYDGPSYGKELEALRLLTDAPGQET